MILDTGVLVAAALKRDKHHESAKAILAQRGRKVIPEPVVGETCYMLARISGPAEIEFLRALSSRAFVVEHLARADRERVVEILEQYRDAELGYVDAAVVAVAERTGTEVIATLDRRDFAVVQPRHVAAFTLVP